MKEKLYDNWNVQLAKTYQPGMLQPDTLITISQKINGVRATYFAGELVSRSGHKIVGFNDILEDLEYLNKRLGKNYVFDGELRLKEFWEKADNLTDNEAFKLSVGIANTQNDMSRKHMLQFIIFDIIPMKDFAFEQPTDLYACRLGLLKEIEKIIEKELTNNLCIVPILYRGRNISMIEQYSTAAYMAGWEGIMINLDASYQYKRTNQLLKYKKFNTIDLQVIGFTEGTGKYEETLGALVCKYKDNCVSVGSGFTDLQRYEIWNHKSDYLNRLVEVKYKDITSDISTGLESLQFPVFMSFKTDKTIPDA